MKTVYLNLNGDCGKETIDEFTRDNKQTYKAFMDYVKAMVLEYRIAGMNVYMSQRPCQNWKE